MREIRDTPGGATVRNRRLATLLSFTSAPADAWRDDAACANSDPALFAEGDDADKTVARSARRVVAFSICERCTVVAECRDDAIKHKDQGVIRGNRVFPQSWRGVPPARPSDDVAKLEQLDRLRREYELRVRRAQS